jgi:predicted permease
MALDRWWSVVRLRLRSVFRPSAVEADLADELRDHLERDIAVGMAGGLSRETARTEALRRLGGLEAVKEHCRDERRVALVETLVRDLQYALRVLRHSPGFTVAVLVSLTLAVGANTAIFQLINAVRLRPLPVDRPGELTIIAIGGRDWPSGNYSGRYADLTYPLWSEIRSHADPFSSVLAWSQSSFDLAPRGQQKFAENGLWVSGEFFSALGVKPALGRLFVASDDVRGCGVPGVVLSHAFWEREYGASPTIVGTKVSVNGRPFEVLGVTQRGFFGIEVGRSFDLALPLCAEETLRGQGTWLDMRDQWWLSVMGRLRPGWSPDRATAFLRAASPAVFENTMPANVSAENAARYRKSVLEVRPGSGGFSGLREQYDTPLWLLLGVAAMVLLIACANIANLLLARAGVRAREIAVRLALGASRRRVARQLLVESLLLAAGGALLGVLLAPLLGRAVVRMISSDVSPMFVDLAPDWRLLAFTIGLTGVTCVLFGLAPAMRATRVNPGAVMAASGRSLTADRRQSRLRSVLVSTQIALALALLVGGVLFGRSLFNLLTLDAGFQQAGVLELDLNVSQLALTDEGRRSLYRDLTERLRTTPGIDAVATSMKIPTRGSWYGKVFLPAPDGLRAEWSVFNQVSGGYFDTLRIPLLAGRDFNDDDRPEVPTSVIVNEAFTRQFLPGIQRAEIIGTTFRLGSPTSEPGRTARIVGLVGDTKYESLREEFRSIVYLASSQTRSVGSDNQFLLRSEIALPVLTVAVAHVVDAVNPGISFHFHDFRYDIRNSLRRDQLMATLCGFFALIGATLAAIGVYSLGAYTVTQRTAEIGIRMALGADRRRISRMILGETLVLVIAGLVAGTLLAGFAARSASGMLFGLTPMDPQTLVGSVIFLAAVALGASYLPARRASRANPVEALRAS